MNKLNKIKRVFCPLPLAGLLAFFCIFPANAQSITGIWLTENGESKVEIYERSGELFGKVIWVKEPTEKAQKSVGVTILKNFVLQEDNTYTGSIFAPHLNKTFKGAITPKSESEITVHGFLGISLFGSSQYWERANSINN
ncbi:MAG: DUF2147 domain-containing protein [Prevotellaceae bacterium]|jgi:uncharacterized protein (DUF2147 family)|nr:DUF2147 domain-containing protein [Prevotellaceae bacterium]